MPIVHIARDEWYPVYSVENPPALCRIRDCLVDIPQEKLDWIEQVSAEFTEAQDYLGEREDEMLKKIPDAPQES